MGALANPFWIVTLLTGLSMVGTLAWLLRRETTRRRLAEHSLRQAREQAGLLDRVRDALLVCDAEDRIRFWNRGAEQMYGWRADEVIGKTSASLLFSSPPPELQRASEELLRHEEWTGELYQVTRSARPILVESHWTLLRDENGQPAGKVVANLDITEKKDLESRFLRAQRLESIGTLAGGIAHDLNNVLTPILMAIKLLQKERPQIDRQALLRTAQASVERGAQMVKQLLSFTGGLEGERTALDLRKLIGEAAQLLGHTLPKSIVVRTQVPDGLWSPAGDATQLSQVLMNLSINARDAMPRGGALVIAAQNTYLGLKKAQSHPEARPGPYVLLTVADTGTGIPPEILPRVFDPFFTTKEFGKGTGLGLSTALGIVRSHGGFITLDSEPGKGTTLAVYLPVQGNREPGSAETSPPRGGAGELILIVDDEEGILAMGKALLEANGYRVLTACGGREALELYRAQQGTIQAVVMDMMMPEMDGPMTMRAIRELAPEARFIATSGLHVATRAAEAQAAGASWFLEKPYQEADLLRALAEACTPVGGTRNSEG